MVFFQHSGQPTDRRLVLANRVLSAIAVLLLINIIVLPPLVELGLNRHIGSSTFVLILALGAGVVFRRVRGGKLFIALALAATIIKLANLWLPDAHLRAADAVLEIASFGVLAVLTLRVVFAAGPVSGHRLMGALAAYLMVALIFFQFYRLAAIYLPGAFLWMGSAADYESIVSKLTYFSMVTLTSLGYGDIVPGIATTRSLAMLEALFGVLYPALLITRLVAPDAPHKTPEGDHPHE
ncbi:MAG: potassium channel family protein [Burkholderiaceae bacterium]